MPYNLRPSYNPWTMSVVSKQPEVDCNVVIVYRCRLSLFPTQNQREQERILLRGGHRNAKDHSRQVVRYLFSATAAHDHSQDRIVSDVGTTCLSIYLKLRRLQSEVAIAQGLHQRRIILVDISDRTPRARSLHHGTVNKNSMIFLNVSLDNRANHDKVSAATARMVRRRDYWVQFLLMASKNGALWAQAVEPLLERSITTPA